MAPYGPSGVGGAPKYPEYGLAGALEPPLPIATLLEAGP